MSFAAKKGDHNPPWPRNSSTSGYLFCLSSDTTTQALNLIESLILINYNSDIVVSSVAVTGNLHGNDWSCSYLIKGTLTHGLSFIAYTYAGELPSCAFGLNSHGLVRLHYNSADYLD